MAREHLYKAKRKDNGEWLEGNLDKIVYEYPNKTVEEYYINETHFGFQDDDGFDPCYQCGFNEPVDENTICEYTNLKDKNGTKVFEGDLIRFSHPAFKKSVVCEVIYTEEEARFDLLCLFNPDFVVYCEDCKFGEVVGNKFDNPELLEVQDEQN